MIMKCFTDPSFLVCSDMGLLHLQQYNIWCRNSIDFKRTEILSSVLDFTFGKKRCKMTAGAPNIDVFVDSSDTRDPISEHLTICFGLVRDGMLPQIHKLGVRAIFRRNGDHDDLSKFIDNAILNGLLCTLTLQMHRIVCDTLLLRL